MINLMSIILMSIMIAIGIAIIANCINIALAQPGSTIPPSFGRPSPTSHPPTATAKQPTMVNPAFVSQFFKNKAECISYVIDSTKVNRNVAAKICSDYGLK